ncbi:MAG: tetratricopeptide repeat protein [Rhodanobacteraceae bacterium]
MNSKLIDNLRSQLGGPRDGAMLRFALANALLESGDPGAAAESARAALEFDPGYTAAWKTLGKALTATDEGEAAIDAYRQGIAAADQHGDVQAGKEMKVFQRRLERARRTDTP